MVQVGEVLQVLLYPHRPTRIGVHHLEQVPGDAQQQETACPEMAAILERRNPGHFGRRWQPGLIDDVPIPQAAVVGANVAQVVQAAQPGGENAAIVDAVPGRDGVLIHLFHSVKESRHRSKVPHLASDPDRQGLTVLGFVVKDELLLGTTDQLGVLSQPVMVAGYALIVVQFLAEVRMEQRVVEVGEAVELAQGM